MGYLELIIKVAACVSALGVLWGIIVRVIGAIRELKETLTDLKTHSNENYMSLLRLTIMSNEMPIGERIVAGHKYLKNGGNGDVKSFLKDKFNIEETVDDAEHYKK